MAAAGSADEAAAAGNAASRRSRAAMLKQRKSMEAAKFVVQFESDQTYSVVDWSRVSSEDRNNAAVGRTVRIRCLPQDGGIQPARISFVGTDGACEQYMSNMTTGPESRQVRSGYTPLVQNTNIQKISKATPQQSTTFYMGRILRLNHCALFRLIAKCRRAATP